jgi:hypothetical protein
MATSKKTAPRRRRLTDWRLAESFLGTSDKRR